MFGVIGFIFVSRNLKVSQESLIFSSKIANSFVTIGLHPLHIDFPFNFMHSKEKPDWKSLENRMALNEKYFNQIEQILQEDKEKALKQNC